MHGLLGCPPDRHDETEIVALDEVVEQRVPVFDDRRVGILGEPEQLLTGVLTEDRIDERVEEEIRLRDADVPQDMLQAAARAADERAMTERLVLRAFLPDDEHSCGAIRQPPAIEHRTEVPPEFVAAAQRAAEPAVVGRFGEDARPAPVRRGTRIEVPRLAAISKKVIGHGSRILPAPRAATR